MRHRSPGVLHPGRVLSCQDFYRSAPGLSVHFKLELLKQILRFPRRSGIILWTGGIHRMPTFFFTASWPTLLSGIFNPSGPWISANAHASPANWERCSRLGCDRACRHEYASFQVVPPALNSRLEIPGEEHYTACWLWNRAYCFPAIALTSSNTRNQHVAVAFPMLGVPYASMQSNHGAHRSHDDAWLQIARVQCFNQRSPRGWDSRFSERWRWRRVHIVLQVLFARAAR
jgi:hypothetical protein